MNQFKNVVEDWIPRQYHRPKTIWSLSCSLPNQVNSPYFETISIKSNVAPGEGRHMSQRWVLRTNRERELISSEKGDNQQYIAESRVRTKIQEGILRDFDLLTEHHPEVFEELRNVVYLDESGVWTMSIKYALQETGRSFLPALYASILVIEINKVENPSILLVSIAIVVTIVFLGTAIWVLEHVSDEGSEGEILARLERIENRVSTESNEIVEQKNQEATDGSGKTDNQRPHTDSLLRV